MSSLKRASVVAGIALAAALVLPPATQAAGRALPLGPGTWLEAGLTRLAGWWERSLSPVRPNVPRNGGEKIGGMIDPDGATTPAPPPVGRTCGECSEIGSGIDPDG